MADLRELATEIRDRLGPPPELSEWPLVSIVVLNRDGADHLRRLLAGLSERTDYPNLELILVDNASGDDSLDFIRTVEAPFPISIIANAFNESFSDGCNQGAELASGGLLLFLNNDVEPFEPGWLRELVACLIESGAGAVGATLIEPGPSTAPCGFAIHQRGLTGNWRNGVPMTGFRDHGADPLGATLGEDVEAAAVAAACLLIGRDALASVGGFSHGYMYGPEDVDLALKIREAGMRIVCSGRSLVIHRTNSTLDTLDSDLRGQWVRGNRRLFLERWGPRVRRELEPEAELELGFCLKGGDPRDGAADAGSREPLDALGQALGRRGCRCLTLWGAEADDLRGLGYDVAVHLRGPARFVPKPGQLNVLWSLGDGDALSEIERSRYDLVLSGPENLGSQQVDSFAARLIAAIEDLHRIQ